ncbi:uncharacterized protein LOC119735364 [Patiria miniata]|uniref:Uncharacterized protein n=1 Tax=Patiria miniata TaxID=46514 RepID=A0A914AMM7_PATMI|nr:uncharacterized protein LOC119735364 [Patiria miniata]
MAKLSRYTTLVLGILQIYVRSSAEDCQSYVFISPGNITCSNGIMQGELNSQYVAECVSHSSSMSTNLTWFVGGVEQNTKHQISNSPDGQNLHMTVSHLNFVITSKNDTVFECCGASADNETNCRGNVCASCRLDVLYPAEFSLTQSKPSPFQEGDDVVLACIPDANPTFSGWIEWRSGFEPDSLVSLGEPTYTPNNSTLVLPKIARNQTGWYRCAGYTFWNPWLDWTPTLSAAISVIVHYGPDITNKDRAWIGANEGYTAVLECIVDGNPLPVVTWYGPTNEVLTNNTDRRMSVGNTITGDGVVGYSVSSRLVLHPVVTSVDYGVYRCESHNNNGMSEQLQVQLKETGKPLAPTDLEIIVAETTESAIALRWMPGYDGGETQDFYLQISGDVEGGFKNVHVGRGHSRVISGLRPDTSYELSVFPQNSIGPGQAAAIAARTLPDTPQNLHIVVEHSYQQYWIRISGIPDDGDPDTCVRVQGWILEDVHDISGLQCVQHDTVVNVYSIRSYERIQSRYCRADRCSRATLAQTGSLATISPTDAPSSAPRDDTVIFVAATIGTLAFLTLVIACYHYFKRDSPVEHQAHTTAPSPHLPPIARTVSVVLPNTRSFVYNESAIEFPPDYEDALEIEENDGDTELDPPPTYEEQEDDFEAVTIVGLGEGKGGGVEEDGESQEQDDDE